MTDWLPRLTAAWLVPDLQVRARSASLAPRLLVGVMAVILFGVDSLRPVIGLVDKDRRNTAAKKPTATDPSSNKPSKDHSLGATGSLPASAAVSETVPKPSKGHSSDATAAIWTTPWIPPFAQVGPRVPLELTLRAAPASRSASLAGATFLPVWDGLVSLADTWRVQLAPGSDYLSIATEARSFHLLGCRQICPMGPPSA